MCEFFSLFLGLAHLVLEVAVERIGGGANLGSKGLSE